ncbi:MAG TPA: sigma-70 factor domain-containing protein, partial [Ignavibacteriaceae bacterium]|nr:sigma-70 factor domain-containing protein [Ignavibacteriaceae bacterium]
MRIIKQFTSRENLSLDKYLQEIGKVELLTPEQEIELAIRMKNGDETAMEQLTK